MIYRDVRRSLYQHHTNQQRDMNLTMKRILFNFNFFIVFVILTVTSITSKDATVSLKKL